MLKLLLLPFSMLAALAKNPVLLKWVFLPAAALLLLVHFAPPQFWPLFRLYAEIEVVLGLIATVGK